MVFRHVLFSCFAVLGLSSILCAAGEAQGESSPADAKRFFDAKDKLVITFVGYSGAGYEDAEGMLASARRVLSEHDPKKSIVNIGATIDGIGAVYALAKEMGFETTGIVSTQAKKYDAEVSKHVDTVFYITDDAWGGFKEGTKELTPTSQAMVQCSDVLVGIGGGAVSRDEMVAAQQAGKKVKFIPADMNHKKAVEKARKKGQPVPANFKGDAHEVFGR